MRNLISSTSVWRSNVLVSTANSICCRIKCALDFTFFSPVRRRPYATYAPQRIWVSNVDSTKVLIYFILRCTNKLDSVASFKVKILESYFGKNNMAVFITVLEADNSPGPQCGRKESNPPSAFTNSITALPIIVIIR
jgi:hypothetical protein